MSLLRRDAKIQGENIPRPHARIKAMMTPAQLRKACERSAASTAHDKKMAEIRQSIAERQAAEYG
jgi:hypothetical protein